MYASGEMGGGNPLIRMLQQKMMANRRRLPQPPSNLIGLPQMSDPYTPQRGAVRWGGKMWDDPYKMYDWAKQHGAKLSMDDFYNRFKHAGQLLGYQGRSVGPEVGGMPPGMPQESLPQPPMAPGGGMPMTPGMPQQNLLARMMQMQRRRQRRPMPVPPHFGPF